MQKNYKYTGPAHPDEISHQLPSPPPRPSLVIPAEPTMKSAPPLLDAPGEQSLEGLNLGADEATVQGAQPWKDNDSLLAVALVSDAEYSWADWSAIEVESSNHDLVFAMYSVREGCWS